METITRIHLARVPYDIEVAAHTKLQRYLNAVKHGLNADTAEEVMNDIELRMTELLAEHGVHEGGIITGAEVHFIEEQLGTPDQFAEETEGEADSGTHPRRLLRDTDNALLGGVASGLGLYFDIDPLIFRLVFAALALAGGVGVVLYLLLWILVPAASSNAEKLQMQGKAVTAATLQAYRQTMGRTLRQSGLVSRRVIMQALQIIGTTLAAVLLVSTALSIATVTSVLFTQPLRSLVWAYHLNAVALGALWLLGLAIIALLVLSIRLIWHRRSSTARRVTFLGSLAAAVIAVTTLAGLAPVVANHYNNLYGNGKTATALAISGTTPLSAITSLNVTADSTLRLTYVANGQPLHATYRATPGMRRPDISLAATGNTLTVSATNLRRTVPDCLVQTVCNNLYLPVEMTLYGPSNLQSVASTNGAYVTLSNLGSSGTDISVTAANDTRLTLDGDTFNHLTLNVSSDATIFAASTTAQATDITIDNSATVETPTTTSLAVTTPANTCSPSNVQPSIFLSSTPTSVTLNGGSISTASLTDLGARCLGRNLTR